MRHKSKDNFMNTGFSRAGDFIIIKTNKGNSFAYLKSSIIEIACMDKILTVYRHGDGNYSKSIVKNTKMSNSEIVLKFIEFIR